MKPKKPKRWVPERLSSYWTVVIPWGREVCLVHEIRYSPKDSEFAMNCFRTKREAQKAAARIRKILGG